jgi:hypothetical protein
MKLPTKKAGPAPDEKKNMIDITWYADTANNSRKKK